MRVNDALNESVRGIFATESLADAVGLMLRSHTCALSVFADDHSLVGMVIEGDLQEHHELDIEMHLPRWREILFGQRKRAVVHIHVDSRCVVEIKARGVSTSADAESLRAVVDLMKQNNIRRLPVMMGDRLVGILVGANLFGVLMVLTPTSDHPVNDANMRDSILATLDRRCQAIHAIDRVEVRDAPWCDISCGAKAE